MNNRVERRQRQGLIAEALDGGQISSQHDVVKMLAKNGIRVTQATASRDLDELGAVRGKDSSGRTRYLLPENLQRGLDDLAFSVEESDRIIVIKTPPGAAQLIASRIDRSNLAGVVGTIAGDDTIFTACDKRTALSRIRRDILAIASGGKVGKDHLEPTGTSGSNKDRRKRRSR